MRTIGLLGGMSWESTALYYRIANELVRERLGGLASASLLVRSLDFRVVRECQLEDRWDDAAALLAAEARALESAGAELVLLCTNYMHRTAPAIEAALGVPFLHIADPVAAAAPGPTIGLLGTAGTVRAPFLRERLGAAGLSVLVPPEDDVDRVDAAIFDELCRGVLSDATRADLRAVVRRLAARGADAVALCCTELELLLDPADSPVPLLPSARLHVTAAVEAALARDRPWSDGRVSAPTPRPGSVALITGGTGGFGRALAAKLGEREVTVVLADLDSERARATAADLGAEFEVLDVTDRAANAALVERIEARHGRLDAAYLNAGISAAKSDDELDLDEFMRVVDVDLFGVVYGAVAARPALKRVGGGAIVVTASLAGLSPMATDPGYSVAKGGAIAFVRSMAPRLAREGTTITAICPGFADTAIIDRIRDQFTQAGFPVLSAEEVADAMVAAWTSGEPGAAYVVQPGVGTVPYRFKGVPSAKTTGGETAVVPETLRPPSMR